MKFKKGDMVWTNCQSIGIAPVMVTDTIGNSYELKFNGFNFIVHKTVVFQTKQQAIDYFGGQDDRN